jgi:hypothetical protein
MRNVFIILLAVLLLSALVGCAESAAVKTASAQEGASLQNLKGNVNTFGAAALSDLQTALLAQIDKTWQSNVKLLTDANGKVDLIKYQTEFDKMTAAKNAQIAAVNLQMAKFKMILQDLDNAIEINALINEYLNRPTVTADDAINLITKVAALANKKASP